MKQPPIKTKELSGSTVQIADRQNRDRVHNCLRRERTGRDNDTAGAAHGYIVRYGKR